MSPAGDLRGGRGGVLVFAVIAWAVISACGGHSPTPRSGEPPAADADTEKAALVGTPPAAIPPPAAGSGGLSGEPSPPEEGNPQRTTRGEWPRSPMGLPQMEIEIKGERYLLEMALDEPTRRRGLSGRTSIAPGKGMIFAHPRQEVLGYWMWECLVDMDIFYLDRNGLVTATHRMKMEPPRRPDESELAYQRRLPRYSSVRPAMFAIELPAGSLDRLDLRAGDRIEFDHEGVRRRSTP